MSGRSQPTPPLRFRLVRTVDVAPTAPLHFDATLNKPDHFPTPDIAWEPGVGWQTIRFEDRLRGLKLIRL